jgi:hypothetical protein
LIEEIQGLGGSAVAAVFDVIAVVDIVGVAVGIDVVDFVVIVGHKKVGVQKMNPKMMLATGR